MLATGGEVRATVRRGACRTVHLPVNHPLDHLTCWSIAWVLVGLQDSTVATAGRRRGRQAKASKQAQQAEGGAEDEAAKAAAALPESRWGEEPARLSSVGLEEDEAHFGTRLRRVQGQCSVLHCSVLVPH